MQPTCSMPMKLGPGRGWWHPHYTSAAYLLLGKRLTLVHDLRSNAPMDDTANDGPAASAAIRVSPWTCPFCSLLCDGFGISTGASPQLTGSDCPRAREG